MVKTKILIVDDRIENIAALTALIEQPHIEIFSARKAEEGLNLVLDHEFALALLDVQMPETSGFDLARLIRGIKKSMNLPIIFVTAQSREHNVILESYNAGAVDLLFKPLDPAIVKSKVEVFVKLDQQNQLLQKQMQDLELLKQEAETANVAKSRFLANMSHEIRTPLGAVLGFVDVLTQDQLSEKERQECLTTIRRNGQLLLRLIDDILDFSKIEAQKLELDSVEFRLEDILSDVGSTLSFKAAEKGIVLSIKKTTTFLGPCQGDPLRIKQVLLNVIGNAIKFTQKGEVNVILETHPCQPPLGEEGLFEKLVIQVVDSGPGISKAQSEKLFQPFSQADASTRRQYGGTGLGLVISKQIAKSMHGDLKLVRSVEGEGSTFEITLQVKRLWKTASQNYRTSLTSPSSPDLLYIKNKKVLVVDDVSDNRSLVERILSSKEVRVYSAASGSEAIKMAHEYSPDLILMDIQMPGQDGYETTQILREQGFENPIVALTAHAMKEEVERCKNSGCDAVLTKPIHRSLLIETVAESLNKPHLKFIENRNAEA